MMPPFSFHCIVALCSLIAETEAHNGHRARAAVCEDVATEAARQGVEITLALAVAWRESAMTRNAVSTAGAVGPMQVIPRFWCKVEPCDHIEAGVRALKHYTESRGTLDGLCAYASGKSCSRTGAQVHRYQMSVVKIWRRFRRKLAAVCDGC